MGQSLNDFQVRVGGSFFFLGQIQVSLRGRGVVIGLRLLAGSGSLQTQYGTVTRIRILFIQPRALRSLNTLKLKQKMKIAQR